MAYYRAGKAAECRWRWLILMMRTRGTRRQQPCRDRKRTKREGGEERPVSVRLACMRALIIGAPALLIYFVGRFTDKSMIDPNDCPVNAYLPVKHNHVVKRRGPHQTWSTRVHAESYTTSDLDPMKCLFSRALSICLLMDICELRSASLPVNHSVIRVLGNRSRTTTIPVNTAGPRGRVFHADSRRATDQYVTPIVATRRNPNGIFRASPGYL